MTATMLPGLFDELRFGGSWRRYQQAAFAAFERDRENGRRRTHIVAPPGSGKTLLGVELVRRIGRRALVLTPNSAVQMQWPRSLRQFGAPADVGRVAGPEPAFPIACMTYQSLCQLEDPEIALGRVAAARWEAERAAATGMEIEEVRKERYEGAAAERRVARDRAHHRGRQARDRARRARGGRARRPALRHRQGARGGAPGRPRRRRGARRVPPPRLDVGLCRARGARRAGRRGRARDRPHRHAAFGPDRRRDRALLRAARPGRLHRPDARRGPRRPPRPVPGAGVADRAARLRARVAGRARHALQGARDHAPRRRGVRPLVPRVGDHPRAGAPPLGRRRDAGAVGGVPARAAGPGPGGCPLPRLRRADAAGRRAARRGLPARARPRRLARAARGLRAALPARVLGAGGARALRGRGRGAVRARLPAHPPGRPARDVGGRQAADQLAGQGARRRRGARRRDGVARRRRCGRSSCATPSWPRPSPTSCWPGCSIPHRGARATR